MSKRQAIVTIDGPSGAGKSTISRRLAARLNYTYLDTGAMYRAVGLKVQRAGIRLDDGEEIARLLAGLDLALAPAPSALEDTRVFLDGEDVSAAIRTPEMGMIASRVSAEQLVRDKLTEMQQEMGRRGKIVAEGRDTGTVVFPAAAHKFYLDAKADERARRRQAQLLDSGQEVAFEDILRQINKRDRDDSGRDLAPLKPAADAVIVDSSRMTIDEVVEFMLAVINTG